MHEQSVECDLLVIGSGAAGLAAAVTAQHNGLDVIVAEKDQWFGGTTALSGGWLWVPANHLAAQAGIDDSESRALTYLNALIGDQCESALVHTYMKEAPHMLRFFEDMTDVKFAVGTAYPDYRPDLPGAAQAGRGVCAQPLNATELGDWLPLLRPPLSQLTLFGVKVGSGKDFHHFLNAKRSVHSSLYVLKRLLRHTADHVFHGRDMLLMSGNALAGRLGLSAKKLGVRLILEAPATDLVVEKECVRGAILQQRGKRIRVRARHGVVCASGGFAANPQLRERWYPHQPEVGEHLSLVVSGNQGDMLQMAGDAGACLRHANNPGAWMPMSRVPRRDGTHCVYPHSYERGKPGVIAVNCEGRRFTNESNSYHDFVEALIQNYRDMGKGPPIAHFVCDSTFIRRYGLGIAKPFPFPLSAHVRSGYLKKARTIRELATRIAVDPAGLQTTIDEFNAAARQGADPLFYRGENAYNRYLGDSTTGLPNPCLAPIVKPPFFAVKVLPGDLGTFTGLATDAWGRVLNDDSKPIEGLYAAGLDMASVFKGTYPGPGANLGPAMTFGYVIGKYVAQQAASTACNTGVTHRPHSKPYR